MTRARLKTCAALFAIAATLPACNSNDRSRTMHEVPEPRQDTRVTTMTMPTGNSGSSLVSVRKELPGQVRAGEPFEYQVTVTNISDYMLRDVVIHEQKHVGGGHHDGEGQFARARDEYDSARTARIAGAMNDDRYSFHRGDRVLEHAPEGYQEADQDDLDNEARLRRAQGEARSPDDMRTQGDARVQGDTRSQTGRPGDTRAPDTRARPERIQSGEEQHDGMGHMTPLEEMWVGALAPGESRTITVSSQVAEPGVFDICTTVLYTPAICATSMAIAPELELTKTGPEVASVGEEIAYTLTVRNSGVGPAQNVVITDMLPQGLRGAGDQQEYSFKVGDLPAGQSKDVRVRATPTRTGEFVNNARAVAAGGLSDTAEAVTMVRAPSLTIEKTGPETHYTNVGFDFEITVTNNGDAPAHNVVIEDELPPNSQFVRASEGGRLEGGNVQWRINTLAPGESRTFTPRIEVLQQGRIENCARAFADNVQPVSDCAAVTLEGVTGLLLEVIDENDPIRIGGREIYTITVHNQGTRAANNVQIQFRIDDLMQFASATGATQQDAQASGTFRALPKLEPGATATWKVAVEGRQPGDARFTVRLTADELDSSVEEAESTRIVDVR